MRVSVVVADAGGEGGYLGETIDACVDGCRGLDAEVVVAAGDGAERTLALGGSVRVRVVPPDGAAGIAAAKARGARHAAGDVLLIVDAPALPEPGSVEQLARDVEFAAGSVVVPRLLTLEPWRWRNSAAPAGYPGFLDLETFDRGWAARPPDRTWHHLRAAPAALGGGLAIGRGLYERLGGFDSGLRIAGVEDLDLSLRAWLSGHRVLLDPQAAVGHDFRADFVTAVAPEDVLADELRLARKVLSGVGWDDWVRRCRGRHPETTWARARALFEGKRASAEAARAAFLAVRVRDESWYAAAFGLEWPPHTQSVPGLAGVGFPPPPAAGTPEFYRRGRTGRACFEDHARHPLNAWSVPVEGLVGRLDDKDAGPVAFAVRLDRWPSGEVKVMDASFQGGGPPEGRAYLSLLTEMVKDRTLGEVRRLGPRDLQRVFEAGEGPDPAAERAVDALRRTLEGL